MHVIDHVVDPLHRVWLLLLNLDSQVLILATPSVTDERVAFCDSLAECLPKTNWVISKYFNDIDSQEDKVGVNHVCMPPWDK